MTAEAHNFDRRAADHANKDSKVRKEILEQMSEIEDPAYRVMLTLMLKMQDETITEISALQLTLQGYMSRLAYQLDNLSKKEDQIKKIVLNGHSEVHDDHHKWIERQMESDKACGLVLHHHDQDGLCAIARQAIEDEKVAKVRKWKVMDGLAEKLTLVLLGIIAATLFPHIKF